MEHEKKKIFIQVVTKLTMIITKTIFHLFLFEVVMGGGERVFSPYIAFFFFIIYYDLYLLLYILFRARVIL